MIYHDNIRWIDIVLAVILMMILPITKERQKKKFYDIVDLSIVSSLIEIMVVRIGAQVLYVKMYMCMCIIRIVFKNQSHYSGKGLKPIYKYTILFGSVTKLYN